LVVIFPSPNEATQQANEGDQFSQSFRPARTAEKTSPDAVEFHPGDNKVVHHAFIEVDSTNTPYRINLQRYTIDIPAGAKDCAIENRYVLPVDVDTIT
jgi:hypothetical protein